MTEGPGYLMLLLIEVLELIQGSLRCVAQGPTRTSRHTKKPEENIAYKSISSNISMSTGR